MLNVSELQLGIVLILSGGGFAIFAIRLLIMDTRRARHLPRHSAKVGVDCVPPDYHPVYDRSGSIFANPFPLTWYNSVVEDEGKLIVRKRIQELRSRREKRLTLKDWKWLDIPWSEWKDVFPSNGKLVNV